MDSVEERRELSLGRYSPVTLTLPAHTTTVIEATLLEPGADPRGYADLAVCGRDVRRDGDELLVTVHNIGAIDAPAGAVLSALDADGREIARIELPAIPAPVRCIPSMIEVRLRAPGAASVQIDPDGALAEITRVNNSAPTP